MKISPVDLPRSPSEKEFGFENGRPSKPYKVEVVPKFEDNFWAFSDQYTDGAPVVVAYNPTSGCCFFVWFGNWIWRAKARKTKSKIRIEHNWVMDLFSSSCVS